MIVWHNRRHDILPRFSNQSFSAPREKGLTFEPVSNCFDIFYSDVYFVGEVEPSMARNKPATRIEMALLAQEMELYPDDYQWEPAKGFGVARSTIHYALLCYVLR